VLHTRVAFSRPPWARLFFQVRNQDLWSWEPPARSLRAAVNYQPEGHRV